MRGLVHLAGSLQADAHVLSGTIRCCTHEILAGVIWPLIMAWVQKHAPQLKLALETTPSTGQMIQWALNMTQDFCIAAEPAKHESIDRVELFRDSYGFFATDEYIRQNLPAVKNNSKGQKRAIAVSPRDLAHLSLIFPPGVIAGPNMTLARLIAQQELPFTSRFKIESFETALALAASDLGVVLVPRIFARHSLGEDLRELAVPELRDADLGAHTYYACFRSADRHDPRIKSLVRLLKNAS